MSEIQSYFMVDDRAIGWRAAMDDTPPERDVRREINEQEEEASELRDTAEWLEVLGPEDMDRERVMDNLEEYGFDLMDDDERLSVPSATETPGWDLENAETMSDEVGEQLNQLDLGDQFRPVEDDVIDELDEDEDIA
jgi:hypothetical protein